MVARADSVLWAVVVAHVLAAPFTKVEESFGLQATHDLLFLRANVSAYDHHEFPGVVPRSFAGAVALAAASAPAVLVLEALNAPKLAALVVVRVVLGTALVASFVRLRQSLSAQLGQAVGNAFVLLTAAQFHLPFYMSRTLPNTFALAVTNWACAEWVGLQLLLSRALTLRAAVVHGLSALVLALAITVPIDSFFWGTPMWPELQVLRFNVVDNRSSEWGTAPFHWYFTSALPRALLGAAPLAVLGMVLERRLWPQALAALFYVVLYSKLPHKEVRFLFPVLPLFNMCAAAALARAYAARKKSVPHLLIFLACLMLCAGTLLAKLVMTWAAYWNYPGGWALLALHQRNAAHCAHSAAACRVHVDVLPAMTGVSRFGEQVGFSYSKTEGLDDTGLRGFGLLLTARERVAGFVLQYAQDGFARLRLQRSLLPLAVETAPQVFIHKRKD